MTRAVCEPVKRRDLAADHQYSSKTVIPTPTGVEENIKSRSSALQLYSFTMIRREPHYKPINSGRSEEDSITSSTRQRAKLNTAVLWISHRSRYHCSCASIFSPLLTTTTSHCLSPNFKYDIRILNIPLFGRHTTTTLK